MAWREIRLLKIISPLLDIKLPLARNLTFVVGEEAFK
jgi:hypothetical protein